MLLFSDQVWQGSREDPTLPSDGCRGQFATYQQVHCGGDHWISIRQGKTGPRGDTFLQSENKTKHTAYYTRTYLSIIN